MNRLAAVKFLDEVVAAYDILNDLELKYGVVSCSNFKEYHIYKGIYDICNAIGITPEKKWHQTNHERVYVSFEYNGVHFFELFDVKETADVESVELEGIDDEHIGLFKDMDKVVKNFDEATTYNHEDSGVLGKV